MAVPSPSFGLSLRWQTQLPSFKACPGLNNVSLKGQMSTPCLLRTFSSNFLPRSLSALQQARRWALLRFVFPGRPAIFGHEQNNGFPCGEGGDGREKRTSLLHSCLEGKVIEEIRNFLEWGGGNLGGDHLFGCCVFGGRNIHTRACFLIGLHSIRLRGNCRFGFRLLQPGRLPGGFNFRLLDRLRDRLKGGIWICPWSGGDLEDTPLRTT
jgi:hypothetical protein